MLQILQTKNIENYSEIIKRLGLEKKNANVVEAVDKDEIFGTGIYLIEKDKVVIYFIDSKGRSLSL